MSPHEKSKALELAASVKPGDLILVKTPNKMYEAVRRIYSTPYDHIVVVVDDSRCLHISYPIAKLVPTYLFTHELREPLVLRPNLSQGERDKFLYEVKHDTVGKRYDSARLMGFMRASLWQNTLSPLVSSLVPETKRSKGVITVSVPPKPQKRQASQRVICSHQIFKHLAKVMP